MFFFKGTQEIQLWRYKDPVLGDCKIPAFNNPTQDKVLISTDSIFEVDVEKNIVKVTDGKEKHDIGRTIAYIVST